MNLFSDPPFGLFAVNDEGDMRFIHVIIMGVMDTPYEGGFFYFILKCPSDYPMKPPKVRLMTTDAGRVRFNPNMYQNGKVCLSILGYVQFLVNSLIYFTIMHLVSPRTLYFITYTRILF